MQFLKCLAECEESRQAQFQGTAQKEHTTDGAALNSTNGGAPLLQIPLRSLPVWLEFSRPKPGQVRV